ncbi:hypothetical protein [Pseudoalteromonas sp. S16_S37]|uniref:hypothetical protein n=1 Tax=Pseudoalteromonas sp. S16_S37 TaxID=2720228 RepID=UPI00168163DC|nr:hypothetical protein [Pseudoalteromonas sp. S16_S37]MBD1580864.1 hypothetical protein [Pseudoalteromonas sp. S16_S37]
MADNTNNTAGYLTRLSYYDGLFLQGRDFTLEQDYGMQMLSLHNQYVHDSFGVANGLLLSVVQNSITNNGTQASQWVVTITAGFAQCEAEQINGTSLSKGLFFPEKTTHTVPSEYGSTFYVALTYGEKEGAIDPDKGPKPYEIVEIPKVVFSSSKTFSGDKAYVVLGKLTCDSATGSANIDYDDRINIYDVNNVFAIQHIDNDNSYQLGLTGTLTVSQNLQVGDTSSLNDKTAALKVGDGIYTNQLEAKTQLKTDGELSAQTATITGDSLNVTSGTISAKNITVSGQLDAANLNINSNFSVADTFTAKQGISIPAGNLQINNGALNMDNGSLTIQSGDITLNSGNLAVTGTVTATGNISGKDLLASGNISAPSAHAQLMQLTVSDTVTANSMRLTSTLDVGSKLIVDKGFTLTGNATLNDDLAVKNNLSVSGYLSVDQNLTVSEVLTAKTVTVTQGLSVAANASVTGNVTAQSVSADTFNANNITATGQLQVKTLNLTDALTSDDEITAKSMSSQTSLSSQSGVVERDFYLYQNWQQKGDQVFEVEPLTQALQGQSVMYRIVIEGVSDLGGVHSELTGIIEQAEPTNLQAETVNNIGAGASVSQSLTGGKLMVTVGQVNTRKVPKKLCFTASIWLFTNDN